MGRGAEIKAEVWSDSSLLAQHEELCGGSTYGWRNSLETIPTSHSPPSNHAMAVVFVLPFDPFLNRRF